MEQTSAGAYSNIYDVVSDGYDMRKASIVIYSYQLPEVVIKWTSSSRFTH